MSPSTIFDGENTSSSDSQPEPLCQIVTPVGMLGYGFVEDLTEAALKQFRQYSTPTALVLDSGSTDSGPSKLALGSMTCPRSSYERDIRKLLKLSQKYHAPLLISSAGGDGSDDHVDVLLDIVREIANEPENYSWKLKTIAIYSEISKTVVIDRLNQITGCGPSVPTLTLSDIEKTPRIVAQMGPEPFIQAMAANPDFDVIIGGRAYDPSPYVAFAAYQALSLKTADIFTLGEEVLGSLTHMGKILECGGLCATPKGMGALGIINKDNSFDIRPLDPASRCVPLSVAAHTLYEKTRPDILHGPGGYLDLTKAQYTQLSDGVSVRVRGSVFKSSRSEGAPYTVKLEGAKVAGFRSLIIGSFKDPILIPQIHTFLESVRKVVKQQHTHITGSWDLGFHVYGLPENASYVPTEVFIVGEAIAESQAVATSLASTTRIYCAHGPYPNQKATSGNFAMGIGGKFELETGECAEFSVYHLMPTAEGEEGAFEITDDGRIHEPTEGQSGLFRWKLFEVGRGEKSARLQNGLNEVSEVQANGVVKAVLPHPVKKAKTLSSTPIKTLVDVAKVIRSKNSGPYEITMDVMFDDPAVYQVIKDSDVLNGEVISRLYGIKTEEITWCGFFDAALAFKATIPRKRGGKFVCSGGYMENDVHGSQQYVPLTELVLSDALIADLKSLKA